MIFPNPPQQVDPTDHIFLTLADHQSTVLNVRPFTSPSGSNKKGHNCSPDFRCLQSIGTPALTALFSSHSRLDGMNTRPHRICASSPSSNRRPPAATPQNSLHSTASLHSPIHRKPLSITQNLPADKTLFVALQQMIFILLNDICLKRPVEQLRSIAALSRRRKRFWFQPNKCITFHCNERRAGN